MNKFQVRTLAVKEGQQINTAWRFPTPARPASIRFGNVAGESRVKIFFYPSGLPGRQGMSAPLRRNERIDPGIVEWIKIQRVFGRIEIRSEIVTSVPRDPCDDARARAAGRADG